VKKPGKYAVTVSLAVPIFGAGVFLVRSWRRYLVASVVAGVAAGSIAAGPAVEGRPPSSWEAGPFVVAGPVVAARKTASLEGAGPAPGGPPAVSRRLVEKAVAVGAATDRIGSVDLVRLGFQLVNLNSRKCLTVTAAGLDDNAIVIQKDCTREAADRWRFVRVSATAGI
jgi:hypothetical protein